jgi:hypothetical protein
LKFAVAIFVCCLVGIAFLSGCAVQEQWAATGGSRADGTVELAYEYGGFEKPEVDEEQGVELAASRCAAWGYPASEPFGSAMKKCEMVGGYGNCLRWLVTRSYQCVGAPSTSNVPQTAAATASTAHVAAASTYQGLPAINSVPPPTNSVHASAPVAGNPPSSPPVVNPNALTNKRTSFDNWDGSAN